jgi:hypothetical protein
VKFRRRKRLKKQNRKINRKIMKMKEMEQRRQSTDGNDKMMKWRLLEKTEMKMQGWVRKRRKQHQKVRKKRK